MPGFFYGRVWHGYSTEEGLGVGVRGIVQHLTRWSALYNTAQIHDSDVLRDVPYYGQVVGDEDKRKVFFPTKLSDKIEDLRLNGNV